MTIKAGAQAYLSDDARYRLLVEAVADYAIYMLDADGIVASWNPGAERFKGYRAEEIIGQHFARFYTEEDRAVDLPRRALATAAGEGRFESEGWRVKKDGSRFWAHVVIDPIRDPDGRLVGYAKITRDLSERREAQEALERTREALFQSQKMEAIGQLTGGVAHDFNNLLMAVLGSLELIKRRVPPEPRILALVDNAIEGAQRGAVLTQRMLAFARRQEMKAEAVSLGDLVPSLAELLSHSIGPGIRLSIDVPTAMPRVLVDANQIEMALLNLVVNGRDAMPLGGALSISAAQEAIGADHATRLPAGHYVRLSVSDTGAGMDEVTLSRAAEPFFTTKGPGKGTGLGLSMVHGIAEQSRGRLVLTSHPGQGTTATIYLPTAPAGLVPASPQSVEGTEEVRRSALSILAVDDDALVLRNTLAMLTELGHDATGAASGQEALARIETGPEFDLVISDYAMPNMTGFEFAGVLSRRRPDIPLLITTGYADTLPDAEGALPRLQKPFQLADLELAIARLARRRTAA